jgi:D-arabinose 1-dehydrogenase-like Zn-dependent alcohol dehydrogenase
MCLSGRENLCFNLERLGFEHPGGYGEYVRLPARNLSLFSSSAPYEKMAVLPDAVATPFHVFNTLTDLGPGRSVLIVGAGGLGLSAVQIARTMGLRVFAADIKKEALELAEKHGAERVFDADADDEREGLCEDIREAAGGSGVDMVLEGVGRRETLEWSLPSLKKDGSCVIMGYDAVNPVPFRLLHIHNNQWKILGAKVSTREELDRVVHLVEEGVIEPEISGTMPITRANDALGTIRRGEVCGRIVLTHGEDT